MWLSRWQDHWDSLSELLWQQSSERGWWRRQPIRTGAHSNPYNAPNPHPQQAYDLFTPVAQMPLNHSNPHTVVPTHRIPSVTQNVHSQHSQKSGITQQAFDPYVRQSHNSSQLLPQNAHTNALISQQRHTHSYSSTTCTFIFRAGTRYATIISRICELYWIPAQ